MIFSKNHERVIFCPENIFLTFLSFCFLFKDIPDFFSCKKTALSGR